jgi:hypothetical protein
MKEGLRPFKFITLEVKVGDYLDNPIKEAERVKNFLIDNGIEKDEQRRISDAMFAEILDLSMNYSYEEIANDTMMHNIKTGYIND